MGEHKRRRAANEVVFREVNERLEDLNRDVAAISDGMMHVICECDDIACSERLPISIESYEGVRGDGTLFVVLPGHDDASIERIVERSDRYWVVRKDPGLPADIAEATDPRAD